MLNFNKKTILVTGCAGFIGFHTTKRLLEQDHLIIGLDNLNNYYDVNLKHARLNILKQFKNFIFSIHIKTVNCHYRLSRLSFYFTNKF